MLLFFRNDTGFGGNNGCRLPPSGFTIATPRARMALFAITVLSCCSDSCCAVSRHVEVRSSADRDTRSKPGHVLWLQPFALQTFVGIVGGDLRIAGALRRRGHLNRRNVARPTRSDRDWTASAAVAP
jgi:hypothetical protein